MVRQICPQLAIALILAAGLPSGAAAQTDRSGQPTAAAIGRHVRVLLASGPQLSGTLVSISDSEIAIRQFGRDVRLPMSDVHRVITLKRTLRKGVWLGTLIGAVGGVFALACDPGRDDDCPNAHSWWYVDGPLGAGVGAAAGAIWGALRSPTQLDRVIYEAPPRKQITLAPMVARAKRGVMLTIRW